MTLFSKLFILVNFLPHAFLFYFRNVDGSNCSEFENKGRSSVKLSFIFTKLAKNFMDSENLGVANYLSCVCTMQLLFDFSSNLIF